MSPLAGPTVGGRTVVVHGRQQGSGVLLTPRTVLTCAHVIGPGRSARVTNPGRTQLCQVVWSDDELDAALLVAPESLYPAADRPAHGKPPGTPRKALAAVRPVRMSAVATDRPVPECVIAGFPEIQRYDGRRIEADQYRGAVLPLAGLIRRTMVFEFDRPPAAERDDGSTALAGLSGAPVYAGESLLGIVSRIPRSRHLLRAECVPISLIVSDPGFRAWFDRVGDAPGGLPRLESVTHAHPDDPRYEEEYARALSAEYRRTKVFGLDELSRRDAEWDLDTAYLSLEAAPRPDREGHAPDPAESVPQRVETLLADRPRVLLRGDAGTGKTTLIWWLAAHAAAGTLDARLAGLNGLVPYVVPLRTLRAQGAGFPSPARLPGVSRLVIDDPPDGWAGRVLESGRALLLVDGLDEVPHDDREEAHRWLSALLRRYPRTRALVTVRPLAVAPDWLEAEGFEELNLLPMRDADIAAFTAAWHAAARLDDDGHEALRELERDLTEQFALSPALRELARTPLLCAVICALHRLREGFLPQTRWELYRSALQMLLGRRDQRRKVDRPEGVRLTVEEHQQLLQRIAVWLVRGGQSEFSEESAIRRLDRALTGMPQVGAQGDARRILTHLLNRSGLLQERTDGVYQFTHRTFQDFLAAKEFIEGDHLHELLRHAPEPQWHDVLLLAAGHCSRRELPVLINGLLAAGRAVRKGGRRTALYALAALCAQHAAWLDASVHHKVRTAVAEVLPPRTTEERQSLAQLGPSVLPLLPEASGLGRAELEQVAELVGTIGGAAAVPYARRLALAGADSAGGLSSALTRDWANYPPAEYAEEVLALLDLSRTVLVITAREQLSRLRLVPHARSVALVGDFTARELRSGLEGSQLRTLALVSNDTVTDLTALAPCAEGLRELGVGHCGGLEGLAGLTDLQALEDLTLTDVLVSPAELELIAGLPRLRLLTLVQPRLPADRLVLTPLHSRPHLVIELTGVAKGQVTGRTKLGNRLVFAP
ncbi:NACHT domain-containing protein [Streptomyces sp. NPDC020141]|uniref:NACHT domain-containing protein n=1 Tax=Streptomyces sp. NPDC020141 TaxID=3365065 RepID=UPI003792B667